MLIPSSKKERWQAFKYPKYPSVPYFKAFQLKLTYLNQGLTLKAVLNHKNLKTNFGIPRKEQANSTDIVNWGEGAHIQVYIHD